MADGAYRIALAEELAGRDGHGKTQWLSIRPDGRNTESRGRAYGNVVVYSGGGAEDDDTRDVAIALLPHMLEEFVVLHETPSEEKLQLRYVVSHGSGVALAAAESDAPRSELHFVDGLGRRFAQLPPAWAVDAEGRRRQLELTTANAKGGQKDLGEGGGEAAGQLVVTLSLDTTGLAAPIVVDPAWTFGASFPQETVMAFSTFECLECSDVFGDVAVVGGSGAATVGTLDTSNIWGDLSASDISLGADGWLRANAYASPGGYHVTPGGLINQPYTTSFPLAHSVPTLPSFVSNEDDVEDDQLEPGTYGHVLVSGFGKAKSGVYNVESLEVAEGDSLECDDYCEVRVKASVLIGEGASIMGGFVIYVEGSDNGTILAFESLSGAKVEALVMAPNGTIKLGAEAEHDGHFVADTVVVGSDAVVNGAMPTALDYDCAAFCAKQDAEGCGAWSGYAACLSACDSAMVEPDCVGFKRGLVDCWNRSAGAAYCDKNDLPAKTYCEDEQSYYDTCVSVCAQKDDQNECTEDICSCLPGDCEVQNAIVNPHVADGTDCGGGDPCNGVFACLGGSCEQAQPPIDPDDDNPCTADACLNGVVTNVPLPAGASCGAGTNMCDGMDYCDGAGTCVIIDPVDPDDDNPCTIDTCEGGSAINAPLPSGTACEDGDLCTSGETCNANAECTGGSTITLPPNTTCATYSCSPSQGIVANNAPSGTSCSDGNQCNGDELCDGQGTCAPGNPLDVVADADPCTIEYCDPVSGTTVDVLTCSTNHDPAEASQLSELATFLYDASGTPLQLNVAPGTIEPLRTAVIHGRVLDTNGTPISGVTVQAVSGQEDVSGYGTTTTQQSGEFDYVVNGGGLVTLSFTMPGLIEAQRTVHTRAFDYAVLEDLRLVAYDSASTVVDLSSAGLGAPSAAPVLHQATPSYDNDGVRTAAVLFKQGTTASAVVAGSTQSLSQLTVRATEFTVGDPGPNGDPGLESMPADLPPQSGFTYAVELSVDEAEALGATTVTFNQPVVFYVDNFVDIPIGYDVPVGYFDRERGVWVPMPNGRVVEVLDAQGSLDIDGDGYADATGALLTLGIDADEQAVLGSNYQGMKLWRAELAHFTPIDLNFPVYPEDPSCDPNSDDCEPTTTTTTTSSSSSGQGGSGEGGSSSSNNSTNAGTGAGSPTSGGGAGGPTAGGGAGPPGVPRKPNISGGSRDGECEDDGNSSVGCSSQTLHEWVDVVGTPFKLHYASDRVPGHAASYRVRIPLTRELAHVPYTLKTIRLEVRIAGRLFKTDFPCADEQNGTCGPTMSHDQEWDGLDRFGRILQGDQPIHIRIGYGFDGYYAIPAPLASSFAAPGEPPPSPLKIPARRTIYRWKSWDGHVGTYDPRPIGLGGWTLDQHHFYNPISQRLYLGNGRRRDNQSALVPMLEELLTGDVAVRLDAEPDGSVLYVSLLSGQVRRLGPLGSVTTVAGTGSAGIPTDGAPSTSVNMYTPRDVAVGPDGDIYVLMSGVENAVWRVDRGDGNIYRFAGVGANGLPGDGDDGPAQSAKLNLPKAVTAAPGGTVFIADANRVRRVAPDGTIHTVAGGGGSLGPSSPVAGDQVDLSGLEDIALGPDGSLYMAQNYQSTHQRILKLAPDGSIVTFAGTGIEGYNGEQQMATDAQLYQPKHLAVGRTGDVYVSVGRINPTGNAIPGVRRIDTEGYINTMVGSDNVACDVTGQGTACGLDGPALRAEGAFRAIAISANGHLVVSEAASQVLLDVDPGPFQGPAASDYLIPSKDGREVYRFNQGGKHLDTRDAVTGTVLYDFVYDVEGRLDKVTNQDGLDIDVAYSGSAPSSITGPLHASHVTTFGPLNTDGYLTTITNPNSETHTIGYLAGGLLSSFQKPAGNTSTYTYDPVEAWITEVDDPLGKAKTFTRTEDANGTTHIELQTPMGRTTLFRTASTPDVRAKHNALPSGLNVGWEAFPDGVALTTLPTGETIDTWTTPDPRFGMLAPTVSTRTTTPGNLVQEVVVTRSISGSLTTPFDFTSWTETREVNGRTYTRTYDPTTRTWTETSPEGRSSTQVENTNGRVTTHSQPGVTDVELFYYSDGQLQKSKHGTRETTYDYVSGWRQKVTNPLLEETTYTNDGAGRVLSMTDGNANTSAFGYDANGRMTSVTPAGRPAHAFTFTGLDQQDTYAAPTPASGTGSGAGGSGGAGVGGAGGAGSAWTTDWDYDDDRNVDLVTYPGGDQLDYQYESATGRLDKVVTTNSGTRDHSYDAAGRLSRIDQDDGATPLIDLAYGYDGRLLTSVKWTIPDTPNDLEPEIVFGYDDNFWLTSETIKATPTSTQQFTYIHDDDGLITRVEGLPAAVGSCASGAPAGSACATYGTQVPRIEAMTVGVLSESWSYSALGELQSYTVVDTASLPAAPVYSLTLERDDLGRITKKTEVEQGGTPIVAQYRYDAGGRLWKVWNDAADDPDVDPPDVEYTYDANGNRLSKAVGGTVIETGTYDDQDRVLTYGDWTYQHSARGEVISRTNSTFDTWTYDYDDFGSLVEVTPPSGSANAVGYEVDGKDRRVRRTVGGVDTNHWVWRDQLRVAADVDSSGLQVSFVSVLGRNVPELMVTSGGDPYRLVTDHLGSVRMVVNVASGALVESYRYDESGVRTSGPAAPVQPFGFAGGLLDIGSGLVRFGARDYDPMTGRWTSKDSILFEGLDELLYRYADGDPVNMVDPNGRQATAAWWSVWGSRGAGAVAGGVIGGVAGNVPGAIVGICIGLALTLDSDQAGYREPYQHCLNANSLGACINCCKSFKGAVRNRCMNACNYSSW